jgi:protein CpxP
MRRFTLSVVITAVFGLMAFTMADAQAPRPGGPGFEGPRGGFGRGGWLALRGVELTDDQREQIKVLYEEERLSREGPGTLMQLHRQLQAEVFAEAPDARALAALQQQIAQAEAVRLGRQVALDQKIAQILTTEQRASIRERLTQAPRPHLGGRGR